jgi:hypothetical protein
VTIAIFFREPLTVRSEPCYDDDGLPFCAEFPMRTRLGLTALILLGFGFCLLPTADAQNEKKEKPTDAFTIADQLQSRVTIQNDIPDSPLGEAIEFLNERFRLNIQVDPNFGSGAGAGAGAAQANPDQDRQFVKLALAENPILNERVSIRKVTNVKLETILRHLCKQVQATYLIHSDQILLVSLGEVHGMLGEGEPDPQPLTFPLVTMKVEKKTLKSVLDELSERANTTIILAPQSDEAGKLEISFKMMNTPIDRAISLLAEMGELRSVRRGNSYLVTSVAKAKLLEPAQPDFLNQGLNPAMLNGIPQGVKWLRNAEREELNKKIDELTQKLSDMEKKLTEKK